MNRKLFLKNLGIATISIPMVATLDRLSHMSDQLAQTDTMPVFFLGHGSPMNGIEENEFVKGFRDQATELPRPNAILVISAHWETRGTYVTAMDQPRTIHDFGGFPETLYEVQYPAPGSPQLAQQVVDLVEPAGTVGLDDQWGLDHGSWTVIKHFYPEADVPVIQMSIDYTRPPAYHYQLAQQLQSLRQRGVLIVGSGNMVHNLRKVAWHKLNENYAYDWAIEADEKLKSWIRSQDHEKLINYQSQGTAFQLAIPTPEHYLPLIYSLALQRKNEEIQLFNDKALGGSLTMTSVKIG